MDRKSIILQDAAITRQINLLRFTAGEKKKVLAILDQLQKDLRAKLLTDLTDFGKARVDKLLKEATAVIDAAYKTVTPVADSIFSQKEVIDSIKNPPWKTMGISRDEWIDKYVSSEDIRYRLIDIHPKAAHLPVEAGDKVFVKNIANQKPSTQPIIIDSNNRLEARWGGGKLDQAFGVQPYTTLDGKHRVEAAIIRGDDSIRAYVPERKIKAVLDTSLELEKDVFAQRYIKSKGGTNISWDADKWKFINAEGVEKTYDSRTISRIADREGYVWKYKYDESAASQSTDLLGLARHEAQATAQSFLAIGLDAALPTEAVLKAMVNGSLIEGAPSAAWWSKQSDDLAFKFAAQVRQGVAGNETVQQIVRRIIGSPRLGTPGIMETSRRGATALVHTSIQQVANDARLATFKANDDVVKGVMQLSTLDSHTTKICIAYSGASWDLDGNPINGTTLPFNGGTPRHWNCRSVLTAITKTYKELGIDIPEAPKGTRASDLGQIPADTSFESFLGRHDKAYVDNLLGPGRAQLWRDGKITLQQLVGGDGRELTLKQLSALSSKPQKALTSFENLVKYSGKKVGLKDAISGITAVADATNNNNAEYALTAINDLKGKAYSGAAIIDKAKNQVAAVSWIKDPARDALKVVTLGSNMPGGGTAMMKQAVQASMDAGLGGKLTLVSVQDMKTLTFYYDKCGFDALKGGKMFELVLTPDAAKKFMGRF